MLNPHQGDRFIFDRTKSVRQVQDCPIYAGMMETMDTAVGIVLNKLKELNVDKNTIVVFTSDNGGVTSGDAFATSALPLRGGKGRQWEGGIRTPYYIKAPGITKAGSESSMLATGTDFFPTLLDLAGLPLLPQQHLDGISLRPTLEGKDMEERSLFWHYPHYGNQGGEPCSIVRYKNWKLIQYLEDYRIELYDIVNDVGEKNNIVRNHPEIALSLLDKIEHFRNETHAILPKPDPRFDADKKEIELQHSQTESQTKLELQHAKYLDPNFSPNKDWWGSKPTQD